MIRLRLIVVIVLLVLSSSMIAQDDDVSPPVDDPNVTIHVVQRGENLFRIAQSYGLTTEAVAEANGIGDPGSIFAGQRLLIPLDLPLPVDAPRVHVVQPGESLMAISRVYELTIEQLAAWNNLVNPDDLFVGQVIVLSESDALAVPASVDDANTPVGQQPVTNTQVIPSVHVVQAGETLFRIATNYGLTVAELQNANGISDPTLIYAGQELILPGGQSFTETLDLPPSITSVNLRPLTLMEGQTGRLQLVTAESANVVLTFLDTSPPIITADNLNFLVFLPIPVWTAVGIYPLDFLVTTEDGTVDVFSLNVQIRAGGYGSQYITLPQDRVPLLSSAVEDNELNILRTSASGFTAERYFDGPMSLPAAAAMNSPFGTRRSYNGSAFDRYHSGADFAGAPGSPVLAAAAGQVVLADTLNIRGGSVMIDHGWGIYTQYAHLSERYVQFGDFVTAEQTIGLVGSTGRATGAHLHWELWVNGVQVDPMQWVREAFP